MFQHIANEIDVSSIAQDHEVAAIVRLIEQHEQELLALRKRLNSHLPASRIPDDILVEIFYHSARMTRESYWEWRNGELYDSSGENLRSGPPCLTGWAVPLVCQRWNNLATNHPRLWTSHTAYDLKQYSQIAIARSMKAALRLYLVTRSANALECFWNLLQYLPRANLLEYYLYSMQRFPDVDLHPSSDFDEIRTLHIWCRDTRLSKDCLRDNFLLRSLAAASLPHLKTLVLRHLSANTYPMFTRPTMTSLEITDKHGRYSDNGLNVVSFLTALSGLPLLEVLRLRVPFSPAPSGDVPPSDLAVHLPHLRELRLCTPIRACAYFLLLVSFLPRTNVSISTNKNWVRKGLSGHMHDDVLRKGTPERIDRIVIRLKSLLLDHLPPPYRLVLIDKDPGVEDELRFKVQIFSQSGRSLGINEKFTPLGSRQGLIIKVYQCHLGRVIDQFPLQDIETIEFRNSGRAIDLCGPLDERRNDISRHWTRRIAAKSAVFAGAAFTFGLFVGCLGDQSDPPKPPEFVLPSLESLILHDVCQRNSCDCYASRYSHPNLRRMLERQGACLRLDATRVPHWFGE